MLNLKVNEYQLIGEGEFGAILSRYTEHTPSRQGWVIKSSYFLLDKLGNWIGENKIDHYEFDNYILFPTQTEALIAYAKANTPVAHWGGIPKEYMEAYQELKTQILAEYGDES